MGTYLQMVQLFECIGEPSTGSTLSDFSCSVYDAQSSGVVGILLLNA